MWNLWSNLYVTNIIFWPQIAMARFSSNLGCQPWCSSSLTKQECSIGPLRLLEEPCGIWVDWIDITRNINEGNQKQWTTRPLCALLLIASLHRQKWNFVFNWLPLNQIQKEAHSWWVSAHKSQPVASELYGCDYWLQHWIRTNIMVHVKMWWLEEGLDMN
jgi:hypothetical protein